MVKRIWKLTAPALTALAASAVTAAGVYCAIFALGCFMDGDPSCYPVAFPVSVAGGVICLGLFSALAVLYIRLRKKTPSVWLTVAELLVGLGALFPFCFLWLKLTARIL